MTNGTRVKEFVLLSLTDDHSLEVILFFLLSSTYLSTIMGNLLIIVITLVDHHLYTPMYFFLQYVAFVEMSYTTTIIPEALANFAMGHKTISVAGCFTQSLGTTRLFLLAVMLVDQYMAVCNPLRYSVIMHSKVCSLLVLCCWVVGFLLILGPAAALFQMSFCGSNVINHFFCGSEPLLKLACVDTNLLEPMSFLLAILCLLRNLAVNLVSCVHIVSSVLHIPSTAGRQKAFSTCSSHITVISITYGSCIFLYVRPKGTNRLNFSKSVAVLNTVMSPLLIPFIYCLRNKQVKDAINVAFGQRLVLCKKTRL